MANLSLSRIILDTLHTISEHYIENRPTALLVSAWLVGVGHYYFFLPKTAVNNRHYIRSLVVTICTFAAYICFMKPIHVLNLVVQLPHFVDYTPNSLIRRQKITYATSLEVGTFSQRAYYVLGQFVDWALMYYEDDMYSLISFEAAQRYIPHIANLFSLYVLLLIVITDHLVPK